MSYYGYPQQNYGMPPMGQGFPPGGMMNPYGPPHQAYPPGGMMNPYGGVPGLNPNPYCQFCRGTGTRIKRNGKTKKCKCIKEAAKRMGQYGFSSDSF